MTRMQLVNDFFLMIGGLTVFLYGMKIMSDNLATLSGDKMKSLLGKFSNNRLVGVGVGAGVTALVQSSTAVTVMVIGFVNVGMMTLIQATAIILGANIGTTATALFVSISSKSILAVISLLAGIGLTIGMAAKKEKVKSFGYIFTGIGMIFIGLNIMSSSMASFSKVDWFISAFQYHNPLLLLGIGFLVTAIVQSSSAVTVILLALAVQNILPLQNAIYIVLGTNIGTCVAALFAGVGANTNAKRAGIIHLMINVIGSIIFFIPLIIWEDKVVDFLHFISLNNKMMEIAYFHMLFNVVNTIILLPFVKHLVLLSKLIVPSSTGSRNMNDERRLLYLDERLLENPPIAVANLKKEVVSMADLAYNNLVESINILLSGDLAKVKSVRQTEEYVNFLNKEINSFLVKVANTNITFRDEKIVGSYHHVITDIERIGDYAENMVNYSEKMARENITFSPDAINDIKDIFSKIEDLYINTMKTFENNEPKYLKAVTEREDEIDAAKRSMSEAHIERLHKSLCTPESGAIYLTIATNLERVADHMTNIAYSSRIYNSIGQKSKA